MIEYLTAATTADLHRMGGKASGLVRLLAAGLDVPEAWVVTADVSLDDERRRVCIEEELPAWWKSCADYYPGGKWAVRSSAVAEDLEGASFAGVYETVLCIGSEEALIDAVKKCWAALEQARATAYLDAQGMDAEAGIALILQRMIEPDAAGVMLTENPMRPFHDEIVIDAAWGLGEAVVSGRTEPDHTVLDRGTGEVLRSRVGSKQVETAWDDDGAVVDRAVPPAKRGVACLRPGELAALHAAAVRTGTAIGPRRDLEWALAGGRLYVLQDRPITGLPPREPQEVWTRRFGDEYLAEYTTPLGHDLMHPWLVGPNIDEVAKLQGRPDIVAMQKFLRHDGYVYLNGAYALELVRCLPPNARTDGPPVSWFDPAFRARLLGMPFERRLLLRMLAAPYKDRGRGSLRNNLKALEQHCDDIDRRIVPRLREDYSALSDQEWRARFEEADRFGQDHFRVIRWGMGHHIPLLQGLVTKLLNAWVGDDAADSLQILISGLTGTRTAAVNHDVWNLSLMARQDSDLLALLRGDLPYDEARQATPASPFWRSFDRFVDEHGHRSSTREISAERWHEQSDVLLGLVRAQARSPKPGTSPMEFEATAEGRRRHEERRLMAALGSGPRGIARRIVLGRALRLLQAYTVYRENQRYHLDYLLSHLRRLLLEQGRRLAERGLLPDRADVFLLSGERFWGLVEQPAQANTEAVRTEVEEAWRHQERHAGRLPAAYLFDGVPTEGKVEVPMADAEGALVGFGASAGQAEGVVRPVCDLADLAAVEHGDVLLASNIDPGWTSVFPLIAGLVTETGGILSHGAILAREYGIPTVTSLGGAMALLPAGTRITVDGTAGTVTILESAEPASGAPDLPV